MDEFLAVQRARKLVNEVAPQEVPCPVEAYVEHIGAKLRVEDDLPPDEPGYTMTIKGRPHIVVNGKDRRERQRFTACHELGHIVLELPSEHNGEPWWSYRGRPPNEQYCDVFAAELLLPYTLFKPMADRYELGFSALQDLADRFDTSLTATGSRFAAVVSAPCAFVLAEAGRIRYASRSAALRASRAWIQPRSSLPNGSVSEQVRSGARNADTHEIDADQWFSDWSRGGILYEQARHIAQWDQTLTLLWFEEDELPSGTAARAHQEDEARLRELDGVLPWPGKRRRR